MKRLRFLTVGPSLSALTSRWVVVDLSRSSFTAVSVVLTLPVALLLLKRVPLYVITPRLSLSRNSGRP